VIERIPPALDGERIDRVVALITGASRARAGELVDSGVVLLDDVVVTTRSRRVRDGDMVEVRADVGADGAVPCADPTVEFVVVHEDPDVVVVDKPAGLVVHPGAGNPDATLVNGLLSRYPEIADVGEPDRPGIVHRLDKGTSGLLVVALTSTRRAGSSTRRSPAAIASRPAWPCPSMAAKPARGTSSIAPSTRPRRPAC
jgi:23S rRNA pseudouridine1911/1915/1917 synthase